MPSKQKQGQSLVQVVESSPQDESQKKSPQKQLKKQSVGQVL